MVLVDKIYLINGKHRHNSVKRNYLSVKKITGNNQTFKILYCEICDKFICPLDIYEEKYKNRINNKLFINPSKDTLIEDTSFIATNLKNKCINKLECFNKEHIGHNLCEKNIIYDNQTVNTIYCLDCDSYGLNPKHYHNIKNNKKLDDEIIESELNLKPESNLTDSIEFLIKINSFRCDSKNHNIEEIKAIVRVYNKKHNQLEDIEINAFYCKNCKLYYIYDSQYKKLLSYGIPICPIHEEIKFFDKGIGFDRFKTESLLRQFGYNVGLTDNLSQKSRQKLLGLILKENLMSKTEILSHLNFLVNSRSGQSKMKNAITKWNEDINYVTTLHVNKKRTVRIRAFRKYITKKRGIYK